MALFAPRGVFGFAVLALLAASLPAQRSLDAHVRAVADGLDRGLDEGRRAVAMVVGRNPDVLDEAGVARAAIESLAENFSDGVVAPVLWTALGGLAGGRALQGGQHRRQHDRPQRRSLRRLRLGGGAARRSRQSARFAPRRPVAHPRRGADAGRLGASKRRAPCGGTPHATVRPTPAGRRRRWPARSA